MQTKLTIIMFLLGFASPAALHARPKAPFSVCVIQSKIPDKDELKRVKNIQKHLKSRFEGIVAGSSPEDCEADLYLLRALEGKEDSRDWTAGTGTGLAKTATVGLRIVGFAHDNYDEPAVDQLFAGKQGFMTRGSWSSKGGAEKNAIKKIHEWADENREAIAEALQQ